MMMLPSSPRSLMFGLVNAKMIPPRPQNSKYKRISNNDDNHACTKSCLGSLQSACQVARGVKHSIVWTQQLPIICIHPIARLPVLMTHQLKPSPAPSCIQNHKLCIFIIPSLGGGWAELELIRLMSKGAGKRTRYFYRLIRHGAYAYRTQFVADLVG